MILNILLSILINIQSSVLPIVKLTGSFDNDYQEGSVSLNMPDGTYIENIKGKKVKR